MIKHVKKDLEKRSLSTAGTLGHFDGASTVALHSLEELELHLYKMYTSSDLGDVAASYGKCLKCLESYYLYLIRDRVDSN